MTGALTYKELRETLPVAVVGALALFLVAAGNMGKSPLPGLSSHPYGRIPFVHDSFLTEFGTVAVLLAMVLGFRQAVADFAGDTQLFLLHRPIRRERIYGTKLVVGLFLCLALGGLAVGAYALWAAAPGTHASPFHWAMTSPVWSLWLASSSIYLGAFLAGIRPGLWWGTRLAPLAASLSLALVALTCPMWVGWIGVIVLNVVLTTLIHHVVATRDFA